MRQKPEERFEEPEERFVLLPVVRDPSRPEDLPTATDPVSAGPGTMTRLPRTGIDGTESPSSFERLKEVLPRSASLLRRP